jgi:hypothetical protein
MWKSKNKAWATAAIFEEWFTNHFVLAIKNNLPFQALLTSIYTPGHPISLLMSPPTSPYSFAAKHYQWIRV